MGVHARKRCIITTFGGGDKNYWSSTLVDLHEHDVCCLYIACFDFLKNPTGDKFGTDFYLKFSKIIAGWDSSGPYYARVKLP